MGQNAHPSSVEQEESSEKKGRERSFLIIIRGRKGVNDLSIRQKGGNGEERQIAYIRVRNGSVSYKRKERLPGGGAHSINQEKERDNTSERPQRKKKEKERGAIHSEISTEYKWRPSNSHHL